MKRLEQSIIKWQRKTFPAATIPERLLKLCEEKDEFLKDIENQDWEKAFVEFADMYIVMVGLAETLSRETGEKIISIAEVIEWKMRINKARKWNKDGTRDKCAELRK